MEVGIVMAPFPGRAGRLARLAEDLGFARVLFVDSQNLAPEVWTQLALAVGATSTIQLGTGVTNSTTRDPAVTASAALALQVESKGRIVLGIGRGDSSVQRIGRDLDRVADFERYLATLQAYLRGETTERNGFPSRLEWFRAGAQAKVPVEVAATGPRVIELAAVHADRIAFAVGANLDHLRWALETAREGARAAGRDPGSIRYGAYINSVVNQDAAVARDAVRGTAATFARFSSFRGSPLERLPAPLRKAVEVVRQHYDMEHHTQATAGHARALEDEFVDWYAVAGPADAVVARFEQIAALGLDFVNVLPGSADVPREITWGSLEQIAKRVVPAVA